MATPKPITEVVVPESTVNLTVPPIVCSIKTDRPLPPHAWAAVSKLAYAVQDAANAISEATGDYHATNEGKDT